MFCSENCSKSKVHKFECDQNDNDCDELLLKRMFYQAIAITGSIKKLKQLIEQPTMKKTVWDFDLSDEANADETKLQAMMCLEMNEHPQQGKFNSIIQDLVKEVEAEDLKQFLNGYLKKCSQSQTVNFFNYFWSPNQLQPQGKALCSTAAFLLHSCDPNIDKIDVGNKFVFVAKKPIKAGEHLFLGYDRCTFLAHSRDYRQEYFKKVYDFDCECNACIGNYAQMEILRKFDEHFVEDDNELKSLGAAKLKFQKNCDYIQDNIGEYPCYEICYLMNQNCELLHQIGNMEF